MKENMKLEEQINKSNTEIKKIKMLEEKNILLNNELQNINLKIVIKK